MTGNETQWEPWRNYRVLDRDGRALWEFYTLADGMALDKSELLSSPDMAAQEVGMKLVRLAETWGSITIESLAMVQEQLTQERVSDDVA